jgi:hypothetical protein
VENTTTRTAIRTDRGLTAAHCGTGTGAPASRPRTVLAGQPKGNAGVRMSAFAGFPSAYVADQETHPPRERSA